MSFSSQVVALGVPYMLTSVSIFIFDLLQLNVARQSRSSRPRTQANVPHVDGVLQKFIRLKESSHGVQSLARTKLVLASLPACLLFCVHALLMFVVVSRFTNTFASFRMPESARITWSCV